MAAKTAKEIAQTKENILGMYRLWEAAKEIEDAATSLRKFVKVAWPYVDPSAFIPGWHIDALCEHLEAVIDGDITKLLVNVPPRSAKSTIVSVMFPAWAWIKKPELKWVYSSYALHLSHRHSRLCRTLIRSPWYQKNWGDRYKIVTDQDTKTRFDNDRLGYRIAVSVDAGTTGEGGNGILYDDLNNPKEMQTEAHIENVINYHENVMSSRLNPGPGLKFRLSIQQRSGERDITGHILSKELGWDHLVIPMEYEGPAKVTSIGWSDPRIKIGESMCPALFEPSFLEEQKKLPMVWAGQYQQRPSPGEGAKFKRHWWNFYNPTGTVTGPVRLHVPGGEVIQKQPVQVPEAFEQLVHGWDLAFKEKESNDFVSGQVWARVGSNSYLLARDTRHMDFPETLRAIRKMSSLFPCPEKLIEDKANGPAVIQTLRNEIPGIIASPIDGGLAALANSMTGYCEAGNWFLPNPDLFPWVNDFIEVFASYPNGKHDDDIAACCHANRRLFDSVSNSAAPEFRVSPRIGEPETACHVPHGTFNLPPMWRRWISVAAGVPGAVLWFAETPKGSLRVYRELSLDGMDAHEAGRKIAEATVPDVRSYVATLRAGSKWNIDVLMEKLAFVPVEPIGCYAELLEHGILTFDPTEGDWEDRQLAKQELKLARFSAQMSEMRDSAWEHLRDLLRFKPADYEELPYDRKKAVELSRLDIQEYKRYMAAVEGRIDGEYPKIKFAPSCKGVIQALGASRRAEDVEDCFLRALLIGISAPESLMAAKPMKEVPWNSRTMNKPRTALRRVG